MGVGTWLHLFCNLIPETQFPFLPQAQHLAQISQEQPPRGLVRSSPVRRAAGWLPSMGCSHIGTAQATPLAVLRFGALLGAPQEAQTLEWEHTHTCIEKKRKEKPHGFDLLFLICSRAGGFGACDGHEPP